MAVFVGARESGVISNTRYAQRGKMVKQGRLPKAALSWRGWRIPSKKSLAMIGSAEAGDDRGQRRFRAEALSIAGLEGSRRRNAAMGFRRVFGTAEA